jgi:hypothetical protein
MLDGYELTEQHQRTILEPVIYTDGGIIVGYRQHKGQGVLLGVWKEGNDGTREGNHSHVNK